MNRSLTPEQALLFKSMVLNGASKRDLQAKFRAGFPQIVAWLDEHGLETTCGMGPKKKGRNPMKYIGAWRPQLAAGELELAVQRLRRAGFIVFSEDTQRLPDKVPPRYTPDTLFRLGQRRNVSAVEIVALGGGSAL